MNLSKRIILIFAVSNLPTQLINFPWIFLYRFLSCMDGGYLSYLLRNFLIHIQKFLLKKNNSSAFMAATFTLLSFPHFTGDAIGFFRWGYQLIYIFINIYISFFFLTRILTLSWFITSMFPTRTTTRCWWPTPWRCGGRRRSGPRRSSYHSSSRCVSCLINFLNVHSWRSSQSIGLIMRWLSELLCFRQFWIISLIFKWEKLLPSLEISFYEKVTQISLKLSSCCLNARTEIHHHQILFHCLQV